MKIKLKDYPQFLPFALMQVGQVLITNTVFAKETLNAAKRFAKNQGGTLKFIAENNGKITTIIRVH